MNTSFEPKQIKSAVLSLLDIIGAPPPKELTNGDGFKASSQLSLDDIKQYSISYIKSICDSPMSVPYNRDFRQGFLNKLCSVLPLSQNMPADNDPALKNGLHVGSMVRFTDVEAYFKGNRDYRLGYILALSVLDIVVERKFTFDDIDRLTFDDIKELIAQSCTDLNGTFIKTLSVDDIGNIDNFSVDSILSFSNSSDFVKGFKKCLTHCIIDSLIKSYKSDKDLFAPGLLYKTGSLLGLTLSDGDFSKLCISQICNLATTNDYGKSLYDALVARLAYKLGICVSDYRKWGYFSRLLAWEAKNSLLITLISNE